MGGILVAGDALLDVHVTPAQPIRPGADVPAVVRLGVGGQGANIAVRLARRGLPVRLACAIGDDSGGALVRDRLGRSGVSVASMPVRATGSVVILLDQAGERTMLSDRVPFATALGSRLPELAVSCDWLVVSGYLLEERAEPLRADVASSVRRMVVGSPFVDAEGWAAALRRVAPDVLVLNRAEATALAGAPDAHDAPGASIADLAASLAGAGLAEAVLVTDVTGVAASVGAMPVVEIAIERDSTVVDTTGAGDAFAATFLAAVHDRWPPQPDALRSAMEEAASVATAVARIVGAQAVVEPRADVTA